MSAPAPAVRVQRFDTLVVGGGQAGLAVGQQLAARDLDFVILDAERRVGDAWRRRWDSLRLFTPAAYSGLPGMPFPAPPAHLPDKDEVADYLARYAERFDLPVRSETRVESLAREGDRFVARAGDVRFEAEQVVVATGPFQRPRVPDLAAALSPGIHQLHSSQYRSPFDLPDGPALVVGAGNSGAQIALELARFRKVWLAGRDTGHLPRRLLGRDLFDWLWPVMTRATADTALGRRLRARAARGGDALIGIPERQLREAGVVRVGRVAAERGGLPVCGDAALQPRVVVWCTGFAPDYAWIDLPVLDARGAPRHRRGEAVDAPGLHFVGLRFQHRMTSSLLGGVGRDAAHAAARVAARAEALVTA
ncbi:NAD(P)-binding domain-containing protein [Roseisolibacter sp. H3M3-2]|uniref:flavin-containing monooxygenase n=1 Tax=Roseisolibacter sp. H3M3-2 TaxID=3031323 RepID=UPI0023DB76E2|nr:NAD(P)-binding domain-containing protein [Roseisolibacter sp. H3M3-2]MDF1502127.1 NAD(P)-binding domain-containing protein [Roseisolibacter sp. H3M3-2]